MTIDELIVLLNQWAAAHGKDAELSSDFGILELKGKEEINVDINNEGSHPLDKPHGQ